MTDKPSFEELMASFEKIKPKKKKPRPKQRKKESKSGGGYTYIWVGNKQVSKSRYLAEKKILKRELMEHEAVYFLDGNKENFNLDNLKVGIKPGKFREIKCPHCKKDILT